MARLEHLGRRSGALHATPVLAWPVAGGFVVPMPYGKDVDWARNLLHAGAGVLQSGGVRYRVGNPRIVPTDGPGADAPRGLRRLASACGLRHVMRVDVLPALAGEGPLPT